MELCRSITKIFNIPRLKNNLVSIGQLQEKGFTILMQHEKCKIYHSKRGLIMVTRMSSNIMFILSSLMWPKLKKEIYFNSLIMDLQARLWHYIHGHLSFYSSEEKKVNGLPQLKAPLKVCEDSLIGK